MKQFAISMDEKIMAQFDVLRGDVPRSAYMRRMILDEIKTFEHVTPSLQLEQLE